MGACEPPEVFHHFLYVCSWVSIYLRRGHFWLPQGCRTLVLLEDCAVLVKLIQQCGNLWCVRNKAGSK